MKYVRCIEFFFNVFGVRVVVLRLVKYGGCGGEEVLIDLI